MPKVFSFFTKSEITNDNKKGIIPPPINDAIASIIPSEKPPVIRVLTCMIKLIRIPLDFEIC